MSTQRVLFVLTSHDTLGDTGKETGFYLPEVTHPYEAFEQAGIAVEFVSPKGGKAPMIGIDLQDPSNKAFLDNAAKVAKVKHTLTPAEVDATHYDAIFYAGGHGTMWDFPENPELAAIAVQIYEAGGVVGAVCHGLAGLVPIRLSTGEPLVAGKTVAGFTNSEEVAIGLSDVVPFLLADKLTELGATHTQVDNFQAHVEVSDRLVTGQNPASARGVWEQMVALMRLAPATAEQPIAKCANDLA
jgi:putative intracellular protease/amidase